MVSGNGLIALVPKSRSERHDDGGYESDESALEDLELREVACGYESEGEVADSEGFDVAAADIEQSLAAPADDSCCIQKIHDMSTFCYDALSALPSAVRKLMSLLAHPAQAQTELRDWAHKPEANDNRKLIGTSLECHPKGTERRREVMEKSQGSHHMVV